MNYKKAECMAKETLLNVEGIVSSLEMLEWNKYKYLNICEVF